MPNKNLVIFIDGQNLYKNAREAFFTHSTPCYYGQVDPSKLSNLLCQRTSAKNPVPKQVRIYSGRPEPAREPKGYKAHMKQCTFWENLGVEVVARPLRYLPRVKPQEKGIDVALAVDFVTMAIDGDYNIGIVASTDSDLRPALEYVYNKLTKIKIEVMAWRSPSFNKRLSVPNCNIWCHYLGMGDHTSVADLTKYS